MNPILKVSHLTKIYTGKNGPAHPAVSDVSFCLEPGEVLGLVGASGSGKSTIVRCVTRLTEATSGTILLNGEDITRQTGRELRNTYRQIQMVFQNPQTSFDPRRTLGFGIREGLLNQGFTKAEAEAKCGELLSLVGLEPSLSARYPHEVSGGQCQRAAIARSLAVSPRLLILDEATSALDVTVQKEIMTLLSSLKEAHDLSYLFICHDLALVQDFCDRVIVLKDGRIIEQGDTDRVLFFPSSDETRTLLQASV